MPDYSFLAADARGALVRGTRFANSEDELVSLVRASGLHLLESREAGGFTLFRSLKEMQFGGVKRRELIDFSNNMGVMFRAGVPLISALEEIRQDLDNKRFQRILGEIVQDIQAGETLHDALAKRPRVFPPLFTNVVQIGENTGSLDSVFFDLARHYKRLDDLVKNVRKAMMYPAFILLALLLAGYVFLAIVFPPLFQLMKDFNVPLPTITVVVMAVSSFLKNNAPAIAIAVVLLIFLFIVARRNKTSRYYVDLLELNFPLLKSVLIQLRVAFFMRYLSMLLSAGMDILRALELATASVNNLVIQRFLEASRQQIIEGGFLSESLRGIRYIPNMVTRMIAIGEQSGNLPEQMEYVADYYNEELERRIALALALMEPILLFALAGVALALVMGVLLPLYNLVSDLSTAVGTGGGI